MPGGKDRKNRPKKQPSKEEVGLPSSWELFKGKFKKSKVKSGWLMERPLIDQVEKDEDAYANDPNYAKFFDQSHESIEKRNDKRRGLFNKIGYTLKTRAKDQVSGVIRGLSSPRSTGGMSARNYDQELMLLAIGGLDRVQRFKRRTLPELKGIPDGDAYRDLFPETEFDDIIVTDRLPEIMLDQVASAETPQSKVTALKAAIKDMHADVLEYEAIKTDAQEEIQELIDKGWAPGRDKKRKFQEKLVMELNRRISVLLWIIADVEGAFQAWSDIMRTSDGDAGQEFADGLSPRAGQSYTWIARAIRQGMRSPIGTDRSPIGFGGRIRD